LTKEENERRKKKMEIEGMVIANEINEEVVKNIARFSRTQISPVASLFGGIIA